MKKIILGFNDWFDNLKEPFRFLFVFTTFALSWVIVIIYSSIWGYAIWLFLACFFRIGGLFIKWYEWKKLKSNK